MQHVYGERTVAHVTKLYRKMQKLTCVVDWSGHTCKKNV